MTDIFEQLKSKATSQQAGSPQANQQTPAGGDIFDTLKQKPQTVASTATAEPQRNIFGKVAHFLAPTATEVLTGEKPLNLRTGIGSALEIGSYFIPGIGEEKLALKGAQAFAKPLLTRALETAGEGALLGATQQAGTAIGQGENAGGVIKSALGGAAGGAVIGGAIPPIARGASELFGTAKTATKAILGKTTQQEAQNVIENTFRETAKKYQVPSRILNNMETKAKTEPIKVLSSYGNKIPKLIDSEMTNGRIDPSGAQDFLKENIKRLSNIKTDIVKANNQAIPLQDLRSKLIQLTNKEGWSNLKKSESLMHSGKVLDSLQAAYPDGQIPLIELDKIKTEQTGLSKAYNNAGRQPFEYDAHGLIGKAARKIVEDTTSDAPTQELNKLIQSHYDAVDLLESFRGKTPHGGMLAKSLSRVGGEIVGAMAGSTVGHPIIGAISGRVGADAAFEILGNNLISNPLKAQMIKNLEGADPAVIQNALKYLDETAQKKANQLFLPMPKRGNNIVLPEKAPIPLGGATTYEKQVPRSVRAIKPLDLTPNEIKLQAEPQRSLPRAFDTTKPTNSATKTAKINSPISDIIPPEAKPVTTKLGTKSDGLQYEIIKKYAGSKPVGTILNENEMTLTPELYPEYFKKLGTKSIPKGPGVALKTQSLASQAPNFKSAEEFVRAQGKTKAVENYLDTNFAKDEKGYFDYRNGVRENLTPKELDYWKKVAVDEFNGLKKAGGTPKAEAQLTKIWEEGNKVKKSNLGKK